MAFAVQDDRSELPTRYVPDPALFVTPEKPVKRYGQRKAPSRHESSTTQEVSRKVPCRTDYVLRIEGNLSVWPSDHQNQFVQIKINLPKLCLF